MLYDNAAAGAGLVDQAFILDGAGDFVSVPHASALNLGIGDFTIDLWVYFNDTAGEQVLIEKWVQRFPGSIGWTLTKLEDNALRLAMAAGDGSEANIDSGVLSIPSGAWTHFAVTRKDGAITLFMNGAPVAVGAALLSNYTRQYTTRLQQQYPSRLHQGCTTRLQQQYPRSREATHPLNKHLG